MSDREAAARSFLATHGWGDADRHVLAGDASDRRYDRLTRTDTSAVLMDAPPGTGDDPADFMRLARHLRGLGLSAPQILADDLLNGFLLLEDLGDDLFVRCIARDPGCEMRLYEAATDVLSHLQSHPAPADLPDLSAQDWAQAATFAPDWYAFAATGIRPDADAFRKALGEAITRHADGPRVLILRDYHAENLLWLPNRTGIARVGLLDFQLGQMGQPGYDLVSLLQDARRDVPLEVEAAICARAACDPAAYAVLGTQRALRILGIFARLCLVGGKAHYLALIPRVWGHLQRNLAHPACAALREICAGILPVPTPDVLARIGAQCGTHPKG